MSKKENVKSTDAMGKTEFRTPYLDALVKYLSEDISPFDVPGHHMGNAENKLKDLIGKKVFQADVNAPIGLDNLFNPKGVLKESMDLMATACKADQAFFLINGTSSGIIAMIMAVCKPNDKIIIPRNVHKSVTSALILSGATPVYIMPKIDMQLEIAHQPSLDDYKKAILKYPSAKAVFVINPTYFGAVIDLEELVQFAHLHGTAVIVDEAHGAHYYFSEKGPKSAMECGADASSVSFHKTGGSLTQSSVLLLRGDTIKAGEIQKTLNILNTTSPSTLLLASLDAARYYMETAGKIAMDRTRDLADYAREEIAKIPGFIPCTREHYRSKGCYDFDTTKLVIEIDHISLTGSQIYQILKREYQVQMELAETYVILGIIAIGTTKAHIDNLVKGLKSISKRYYNSLYKYPEHDFEGAFPFMLVRPRTAFNAPLKKIPLEESEYAICKESIMIYPPGIPLVVPGEIITKDLIKALIEYRKTPDITILSENNDGNVSVVDTSKWIRYEIYRPRIERYIKKRLTVPRNDEYYLLNREFSTYSLAMNWSPSICKNKRVNLAFKREISSLMLKIIEETKLNVMCSRKAFQEINTICEDKVHNVSFQTKALNASESIPFIIQNKENRIRFISYNPSITLPFVTPPPAKTKILKRFYDFGKYDVYVTDTYLPPRSSFILNGRKNCIVLDEPLTVEDSLIKLSQREIEENIKIYFNVESVTWIPRIPADLEERGYKLSDLMNFISPKVVCVSYPKSKGVLSTYMDIIILKLKKEGYEVVKFPIVRNVYPNKMEIKALNHDGLPLIQAYVSFVEINDVFFVPNNLNDVYNKEVKRKILKFRPESRIIFAETFYLHLMKSNLSEFIIKIPELADNS